MEQKGKSIFSINLLQDWRRDWLFPISDLDSGGTPLGASRAQVPYEAN